MTAANNRPGSESSATQSSTTGLQPTLLISPLRSVVAASGCTLDALVRVQAPAQPVDSGAAPREPLRLSVVVDRSGSMNGAPLEEALRCVNHIASRLQATDQMAVVLYDNQVQLPVPLQAVNATTVSRALAGVESGGNTALFDGWKAGVDQLLGITAGQLGLEIQGQASAPGSLSRVILLSDGQANHGLTEPLEIAKHCSQALDQGVSTTTVGLGRGFNEDLMIGMARAGGGQQYYGQTAEDLYDNFDEELALLQSLFLRQLHLKLTPAEGVIAEPLGVVEALANGQYRLSDLAWGAESWLLVRLHIGAASVGSTKALLAATLTAQVQQGGDAAVVTGPSTWHFPLLALPVVSDADWQATPSDETVANRALEVSFGEQAGIARDLLQRGRLAEAEKVFDALGLQVAHHPWLLNKLASLRELSRRDADMASKELLFSHMKMSKRNVSMHEQSADFSINETDSTAIPAYLRRKMSEGKGRKNPEPGSN